MTIKRTRDEDYLMRATRGDSYKRNVLSDAMLLRIVERGWWDGEAWMPTPEGYDKIAEIEAR